MLYETLSRLLATILFQINCAVHSGLPAFFWVQPQWSIDDMPDQTGKIVVVTGGNSGTGYATCKAYYDRGAKVYMASRSAERAKEAIASIQDGHDLGMSNVRMQGARQNTRHATGTIHFLELDLADLDSVQRCVDTLSRSEKRIDILFANAGIMATPKGQYTKQGYSLQFGTNVLAHQRLVSELLPLLEQSRVIFSSSAGHAQAPPGGIDYNSLTRHTNTQLNPWVDYGQTKWGDIALAKQLDAMHGPKQGGTIISAAVHPGMVATNLASHFSVTAPLLKWAPWLVPIITRPSIVGATNQLWIATCPEAEVQQLAGQYIVPFQAVGRSRPDLDDPSSWQQLWKWCEEQGQKRR